MSLIKATIIYTIWFRELKIFRMKTYTSLRYDFILREKNSTLCIFLTELVPATRHILWLLWSGRDHRLEVQLPELR